MRILFITSSSINGGAQKHIMEMFKSLTALGHIVYLIAPSGWLVDELCVYNSRIYKVEVKAKSIPEIEKIIDQVKPDITNTFILSGGVFGTFAWKKRKWGKLFVTVNNPVIYPGISIGGRILYPHMYRWMSYYASAFLVKADKVRDEVAGVIKNKRPVISIKNGIDFQVFNRDREYPDILANSRIKEKDIVITNVAALDIRKGQQYLIEAVTELHKNYPVQLLLVGEGNDKERLRNLVMKKGAENYIHFLGRRSDINVVLANTRFFVLPSLHEGLPNALMEAMAMGLPCIAADVGGVSQLIDNGKDGIIVRPESAGEIQDAITQLLNDTKYERNIGERACLKMEKDYSQEVVSKELESIYLSF